MKHFVLLLIASFLITPFAPIQAAVIDDYVVDEGIEIELEYPDQVDVSEEFEVTVTIENESGADQFLHSIDIDENYLDGMELQSSDPEYTESFALGDGTITHFLEVDIEDEDEIEVVFTLIAGRDGTFGGALDVCFEDGGVCEFLSIETIVGTGVDLEDDDLDDDGIPDALVSVVNMPAQAEIGEEFEVAVTITNGTDDDQFLHSIDIADDYLVGAILLDSDPTYTESFVLGDGTTTHFLEVDVPAGDEFEVVFIFEAVYDGTFGGSLDICFDEGATCDYQEIEGTFGTGVRDNSLEVEDFGVDGYEYTLMTYYIEDGEVVETEQGYSIPSGYQEYADDTEEQEEIWEDFLRVGEEDYVADHVSEFQFFSDGLGNFLAYVIQDNYDLEKWIVAVDMADAIDDPDEFELTLHHEFAHILSLESDQTDLTEELWDGQLTDHDYERAQERDAEDCDYFYTGESCSFADSYINAFYESFWTDIYDDHAEIADDEDDVYDFFLMNEDQFITDYAATNVVEDLAESYSYYMVWGEQSGDQIWEQKLNFFTAYDELVQRRVDYYADNEEEEEEEESEETYEESEEESSLIDRLAGYIMLMVDQAGEAWYIDPITRLRYYLADGPTAYEFLRTFGLGITNANLEQIPTSDDAVGGGALAEQLSGRILLQVEEHGEAWYVNPTDLKRYYMADGDAAYTIMRELSEGTMAEWISDIRSGDVE